MPTLATAPETGRSKLDRADVAPGSPDPSGARSEHAPAPARVVRPGTKVRVAVIGVGHLGQHHARHYRDMRGVELVGVVDTDRRSAVRIASTNGCNHFFDHRDLRGRVDAVSIVVPTSMHHAVARDFLEHDIHVLVEKPITSTVEQARDLIDLARRRGLILQVGHIERFNAGILGLQELLTRPAFVECHRMGPFTPRIKDVGVVLDLMIHDIDIVLQLVDSPLVGIEAHGVSVLSNQEDIATARFHFENGCVANLTASRVSPDRMRKLRVFQNNAFISVDYATQSLEVFTRKAIDNPGPNEPPAQIVVNRLKMRQEDQLRAELSHFVECVRSGAEPYVTGEHGRNALQVAVAVTERIHARFEMYRSNFGLGDVR